MKSIALVNFKGGAGKTTATLLLAKYAAIRMNKKVLLVDFDSQMNLTLAIEMEENKGQLNKDFENWSEAHQSNQKSFAHLIENYEKVKGDQFNFSPSNYIFKISPNLHLVPADVDMYWLEFDVYDREKVKNSIKNFLIKLNQSNLKYDYVFFDCPANFNDLSYSVLSAVDMVLVPVNPDVLANKALNLFIDGLVRRIKSLSQSKISIFMNKAKIIRDFYLTKESKFYLNDIKGVKANLDKIGTKVNVFDCFLPEGIDLQKIMVNQSFPVEYDEYCKCLLTNIQKLLEEE
ncbi:MAG: ParA family protein [Candidatus Kapabacteria bacterium]|nr:ParA family protein [Candidatus Kapabacteria bacterium]